jgi:hypothetical protein
VLCCVVVVVWCGVVWCGVVFHMCLLRRVLLWCGVTRFTVSPQALEQGDAGSSGMGEEAWRSLTAHLSAPHCHFFAHWFRLVELEESEARERRPELWAVPGPQRERQGVCMAHLTPEVRGVPGDV